MPQQASDPLLRLSGLSKHFGAVCAVSQVDLQISPGEFVAIFGPNGAGKTTLLQMVAGLTQPTSGEMTFREQDSDRQRSIGYVSHQSLLYNEMTGRENLMFFAQLHALSSPKSRTDQILAQMGLERAAEQLFREYSRGMKQRLALARALLHDPELLLLDEPYAGLDQQGSRLLSKLLLDFKKEDRTILLITHNLDEGLVLCDRAMIQYHGEIVFQAYRDQVQPDDFVRLYFQVTESF